MLYAILLATVTPVAHPSAAPEVGSGDIDQVYTFAITAGIAAWQLNEFSTQSGLQVLFGFEDMTCIQVAEVIGEMKPFDALDQMIQGTPIRYDYVNEKTVTLRAPPCEGEQADPMEAIIIGETCQFGAVPAAMAEELLGLVPGDCWCCTYYDSAYDTYLYRMEQYGYVVEILEAFNVAGLVEPPVTVAAPEDYFCAALASPHACPVYEGTHTNMHWNGERSVVTVQSWIGGASGDDPPAPFLPPAFY